MPTNLLDELWRTCGGIVETKGCGDVWCRKAFGVIGRELKGVEGLCADLGEAAVGEGGVGVDVAVRLR